LLGTWAQEREEAATLFAGAEGEQLAAELAKSKE